MKIGISLGNAYKTPTADLVKTVADIGFEAIAPSMPLQRQAFDLEKIADSAKACGVCIPFLHAPFLHAAALWQDAGNEGALGEKELMEGIELCRAYEIPQLVVHAWIGFEPWEGCLELGFSRMDRVVSTAKRYGVGISLENTEGEKYLHALMQRYAGEKTVGFCYDSGHEQCYNRGENLLALYGDRLTVTHLNDNLGICDPEGRITPLDDLHLLPFDGIIDWEKTALRLKKSALPEVLNFELNINSKPGRHENDAYEKMTYEAYFTEAYQRACRVRALIEAAKI